MSGAWLCQELISWLCLMQGQKREGGKGESIEAVTLGPAGVDPKNISGSIRMHFTIVKDCVVQI